MWGHLDMGTWGPTLHDEVDLGLGDLGAVPHHLTDVFPRVVPRHRAEVDGGDGEDDAVLVGVCGDRRGVGGRTDGQMDGTASPSAADTCERSGVVEEHQGGALLELPLDAGVPPVGAVGRTWDVDGCGERWGSAGGEVSPEPAAGGGGLAGLRGGGCGDGGGCVGL